MDRIRLINGEYILITRDWNQYPCRIWTHKKDHQTFLVLPRNYRRRYLPIKNVIKSIIDLDYYVIPTI